MQPKLTVAQTPLPVPTQTPLHKGGLYFLVLLVGVLVQGVHVLSFPYLPEMKTLTLYTHAHAVTV